MYIYMSSSLLRRYYMLGRYTQQSGNKALNNIMIKTSYFQKRKYSEITHLTKLLFGDVIINLSNSAKDMSFNLFL